MQSICYSEKLLSEVIKRPNNQSESANENVNLDTKTSYMKGWQTAYVSIFSFMSSDKNHYAILLVLSGQHVYVNFSAKFYQWW